MSLPLALVAVPIPWTNSSLSLLRLASFQAINFCLFSPLNYLITILLSPLKCPLG